MLAVTSAFGQKIASKAVPKEVDITSEPHHHLILQNEYVRVFNVDVEPRDATLMHRHRYDYAYVVLGPAQISNDVQGRGATPLTVNDGDVKFSDGNFVHSIHDTGATPFRNITVEFLQDAKMRKDPKKWDESDPMKVQNGTYQLVLVKDGVRVSRVELQTAGVEAKHRHAGPHLVIALTDLTFRAESPDKSASTIEMKMGDVKWIPGDVTHTVTNVGSGVARAVTMEF